MIILGLLSTNIAGSTKRTFASGWVFVCYCIGQISGPQFFKSEEAPAYRNGIVAMLCGFCINLALNQILRYVYVRENRRRETSLQGLSEEELQEMVRQSEVLGFEDATDQENVSPLSYHRRLANADDARRCLGMCSSLRRILFSQSEQSIFPHSFSIWTALTTLSPTILLISADLAQHRPHPIQASCFPVCLVRSLH